MIVDTLPNDNVRRRPISRSRRLARLNRAIDAIEQIISPGVEIFPIGSRKVFARDIIAAVARNQNLKLPQLLCPGRRQPMARIRQVVYWLCREHTSMSLAQIGRQLGNRDHTTVMHGCRVIDRLIASDTDEAQAVRLIIDQCRRELGLPHDGAMQ